MAQQHIDIFPGALGEMRAASTAGGGTALTTTASLIMLPDGTKQIAVVARNFSGTTNVVKMAINPFLEIIKTTDALVTEANQTIYSHRAQNPAQAAGSVVLSSLNTFVNNNFLMIGSWLPFRGVKVDVQATNSNASVLLVEYWNGTAWVTTAATDGTASAGATFGQDGDVTWTVPSAWVAASPHSPNPTSPNTAVPAFIGAGLLKDVGNIPQFWTRWSVSAALDSSTTVNSILAYNRSTSYSEFIAGQGLEEAVAKGPGGVGCIEALTDLGTANLIVNAYTRSQAMFGS